MKKRARNILRLVFAVIGAALVAALFITGQKIDSEVLLRYIPAGPVLAPLALLVLYALKSLLIVFPMLPLQLAAGYLFSGFAACLVNTAGYAVCAAISYFRGKTLGHEDIDELLAEHERLSKILSAVKAQGSGGADSIFICFLLRVIGLIPPDVTSMYLGFTRVPFAPYMLATIAGALPKIVIVTLMGSSITDPTSPAFIISAALTVALTALSVLGFYLYRKKASRADADDAPRRPD